ncbi:MAG: helix-turn-helix domain-containing protein [Candidatus Caldarchaeum sp.]
MLEAAFRVKVECPWISRLENQLAKVKILSCRPVFGEMGASAFVSFSSKHDPATIQKVVMQCRDVVKAEFRKTTRNSGVGIVESIRCPCSRIGLAFTHVLKVDVREDEMVFHVVVYNRKEVEKLAEHMKGSGVPYALDSIKPVNPKKFLTPRQEQILMHAYMRGYFEYPRPSSIREMAKDFGVSTPTYVETLRKALAKVVSSVVF